MSTPDPIVALFAKRLRRERLARSWSLRDLAERADVAISMLSRAENELSCPSLTTAVRVATAFGIPLGDMTGTGVCGNCDGQPPAGFICGECGRKGER
jgi:transcriptional regulator with XRE-family HTH domain